MERTVKEEAAKGKPPTFDPFLLAVLSKQFEAIIHEMTNTVMKASRSATIKNSRDLSCGILTYDHRLICSVRGIPAHVTSLPITTRPITEFFDDINEGDAFLNNCTYTGGTHYGDLTLCVPVYCDGEPMFWAIARSHHADVGAHTPSALDPYARTVYEEGMQFPCIRMQEHYQDKADLIRMCRIKIRSSHIWYGDYRAQVGGTRTGERRLKELVGRYGKQTMKDFVKAWLDYGEQRMVAAINELPAGTWCAESTHDPVPDALDDGVTIRVKVTVEPEKGLITVDARANDETSASGLNLSEACATNGCKVGVFYNLDQTIPHNEGSSRRIKTLLRDGSIAGRPTYPAGTSMATTNVCDRLVNAVNNCFAQMGAPHGMGEGGYGQTVGTPTISGVDSRKGGQPYINWMALGYGGGPGLYGHDGWLTYGSCADGGMMVLDSVEINESMFPIIVEARRISKDTLGHGEWDGAPGVEGVFRAVADDVTAVYMSDGEVNPPKGVLGGHDSAPAGNWLRGANGEVERLPAFHTVVCKPGEALIYLNTGGGGYGDPRRREPARVLASVNRGWLSKERAETVYGLALTLAENGVDYIVDEASTAALRNRHLGAQKSTTR